MEQMKKKKVFFTGMFLLLLSLFFSVMLPYYIPYNYPYCTISEEWKEMIYEKQQESLQIPENLVKGQPTRVLIESVLNSPNSGRLLVHGFDYKRGYQSFKFACNGLEELENREDVIPVILELYENYPIVEFTDDTFPSRQRLYRFERIIAQDEYVGQMDEEELKRFSEIAAEKYYQRVEKNWDGPNCGNLYSVLELGSYADKIIPPDFSGLPK